VPEAASGERPDRERWGDPVNYRPRWAERSRLAASLVKEGTSVLEIGVGTGVFRDLVSARTAYVGADLEPLDPATIPLDIDRDELPERTFDYAVLLGVITYLHRPREAARKICGVADRNRRLVLLQARGAGRGGRSREPREPREPRLAEPLHASRVRRAVSLGHGFELASSTPLAATEEFEEFLMEIRRSSARGSAC
jgi:SAM-dependent methyltransferase